MAHEHDRAAVEARGASDERGIIRKQAVAM
jgi:hypothetical protein